MVLLSLEKGPTVHLAHKQWDTIRKLRSAYSNQVRASAISNFSALSMADNKGSYSRLGPAPCGSLWLQRFMERWYKRQRGQDSRPNRALSSSLLMLELLSRDERKAVSTTIASDRHRYFMTRAYFLLFVRVVTQEKRRPFDRFGRNGGTFRNHTRLVGGAVAREVQR